MTVGPIQLIACRFEGFEPKGEFEDGMRELSEWVNAQPSCDVDDQFEKARKELDDKKLTL